MATLATLATLKLSTAVKPAHMPAIQVRRNKLVKRLWEQMELTKAQKAAIQFTAIKFRTLADPDASVSSGVAKRLTGACWPRTPAKANYSWVAGMGAPASRTNA